jgi:8-oxo-dGTP pyrophosphatase MutT (NUDIX family)
MLSTQRLNDLVYVYYNLRLWVKQLKKEPDIEAISLDNIDTTSQWRVEIQEPEMEEALEWLEEHADNLMEEGATEEEEEEEDVPLTVDREVEEEIGLPVDPMPPPPPQRAILELDLGLLGLEGGNTLFLPPRPHNLPPQREHLKQLELPLQDHLEYLHDHLLLPEENWCPLPVKGLEQQQHHDIEGINDLDSYDLSFSFYHVLFSIYMPHDDSSHEIHLF